jgi:hypothetical protein
MASPIEGHSQDVKAHGGSIGKFQDLKRAQSKILSEQVSSSEDISLFVIKK